MDITSYIEPELFIIVPVLYMLGLLIKKSPIRDNLIPFILGGAGMILVTAYRLQLSIPQNASEIFGMIFSCITQGLLCASASVYANNIVKQIKKGESLEPDKSAEHSDS